MCVHPVRLGHPVKRVRVLSLLGNVLGVTRLSPLGQSCTPSPPVLSYGIQEEPTDFCTLCHTLLSVTRLLLVRRRSMLGGPGPTGGYFAGPPTSTASRQDYTVHFLEKMKSQITQQNRGGTSSGAPDTPAHGGHWFSGPNNVLAVSFQGDTTERGG